MYDLLFDVRSSPRSSLFRLEKRVPLDGHQYKLYCLPFRYDSVMETLKTMGCSWEAVGGVRGIGNVTLLARERVHDPYHTRCVWW